MAVTWSRALGWRLGRQLLDPVGTESVAGVVRRLGAVPAQSDLFSELMVRVRRQRSRAGDVARALAEGRIIKTYSFRGATHLMAPEDAGAYLALRAVGRQWELPSWREFYRLEPDDWPAFRDAVAGALADGPLTPGELSAALARTRRFRHLAPMLGDQVGTLHKPLAWQGVLSFGPPRDGSTTFQTLAENPHWAGIPDLDEAGHHAVGSYFRTYGPAPVDRVQKYLGAGLSAGGRRITTWIAAYGDDLAPVDIEGRPCLVLRDDLDALSSAKASSEVRLIPGHDPWVMGAGTDDPAVVPPPHRQAVTRGAHLVLAGGVVSGTWALQRDRLEISWWADAGRVPRKRLEVEAARVAELVGGDPDVTITTE